VDSAPPMLQLDSSERPRHASQRSRIFPERAGTIRSSQSDERSHKIKEAVH